MRPFGAAVEGRRAAPVRRYLFEALDQYSAQIRSRSGPGASRRRRRGRPRRRSVRRCEAPGR